jgi:hypothetical protein
MRYKICTGPFGDNMTEKNMVNTDMINMDADEKDKDMMDDNSGQGILGMA